MFKKKKKRTSIGIDIGNRAIKVVAIESDPSRHKYRLTGYKAIATKAPGSGLSDKAIAQTVREAAAGLHTDERGVRVAVSGNTVVVRYMQMPEMPLDELRSAIRYEAGQHIPFDVKDVEIDCTILKHGNNGGKTDGGKMDVMLVAARKSACERVLKLIKAAGLVANCIDADPIASINAYLLANPSDSPKPVALLNIGAKQTSVNILLGGVPTFTRSIEIGGEGLSLAIARGLGVELEEAERLKVFGDPLIQPHLDMVLNSIARQVRTSFDYFEGLVGQTVASVFLSGGTSKLEGIDQFLGEALGVPTRRWIPLEGIETDEFADDDELKSVAPTLDVAVGLAARSVEGS